MPTIHFADAVVGVASRGAVFVNVWKGESTLARMDRVLAAQRTHWETTPKHALITVIEPPTPMVSDEVRAHGNKLLKESGPHLLAIGYVIEGTGFFAATARAYVTTRALLRQGEYAVKSFASPRDAAAWIAPIASAVAPTTVEAIVELVEAARRAIR